MAVTLKANGVNGNINAATLETIVGLNTEKVNGKVSSSGLIATIGLIGSRGAKGDKGEQGDPGIQGEDGFSPIVTTSKSGKVTTITITDAEGEKTATINDGEDGINGQDGNDGYSPSANVTKSGSTATITITDKNGTTTTEISDGQNGTNGIDGQDGYSPSASVSKVGKVATITIIDKNGTTSAQISDGQDGQGTGDMLKSVYDTNNNGIVDNAEKVNNHTVQSDVPSNAVFTDTTYTAGTNVSISSGNVISATDTTYTAGTGIDITNGVISNTQTSAAWGNITGTLSDQTDLNTALGNKVDKVTGKGLSTEDYTTTEKNKLAGIEAGAEVNPNIVNTKTTSTDDVYCCNYVNDKMMKSLTTYTNIDTIQETGTYSIFHATGTLPSGYSQADDIFILEVKESFNGKIQILHDCNSNKSFRRYDEGEYQVVWSSWVQLTTNVVNSSSVSTEDTYSCKYVNDSLDALVNLIYPVGSIYMSVNNTDPGTIFGGTWSQIKDKFLLACGTTYANGATGGSATNSHTHDFSHTHNVPGKQHSHGLGSGYAKLNMGNGNPYMYADLNTGINFNDNYYQKVNGNRTAITNDNTTGVVKLGGTTDNATPGSVTTSSQSTSTTGAASDTNNMPPYLAVYVWKRTA